MARQTIKLNEMREVVGKAMFPADWLGGVTDEDWALITGPYGIKQGRTATPGGFPSEIAPCPSPKTASLLDRALGRHARTNAQYSTVDSWIEDHGLPVDPKKVVDRKAFKNILRANFRSATPQAKVARGRTAKLRPRVIADMIAHLESNSLTAALLGEMPDKEMEARYSAGRETCNLARRQALLDWKTISDNSGKK
jgi:hypothetical protein